MNIQTLLETIQDTWIHRVSHDLARGAGVRENVEKELSRFFNLLSQAVLTGDPSWIDPILFDWSKAPTESDLAEGQYSLSTMVSRASALTFEVAKEKLSPEESLELLSVTSAVFSYALAKSAQYEFDTRISHATTELTSVQEKLEKLDRSKSNFISVAAHELKTPLTLIEGYSGMINDLLDVNNKNVAQLLEGIQKGVSRLHEIVDDMIDVSLIDNSLLSLNLQPLWLGHTLGLLQSELKKTCDMRKLNLEIDSFDGSEKMIFADPERIYQALRNVLTNAIKFTPDGGNITIGGRLLPGFVEITVTDTGIGISLEDQLGIFEKFSQLGETAKHSSSKTNFKGGGPGLGLPIARGIIEAHGGNIWVESEGCDEITCPGATFHILLPDRSEAIDPEVVKLYENDPLIPENNLPPLDEA